MSPQNAHSSNGTITSILDLKDTTIILSAPNDGLRGITSATLIIQSEQGRGLTLDVDHMIRFVDEENNTVVAYRVRKVDL